jgi:hypothetical protein
MSRLLTRMKEQLLAACFPIESHLESHFKSQTNPSQLEPIALGSDQEEFSLECLLRVVKIRDKRELLSRVNYYFPQGVAITAQNALDCADRLNTLLVHSRVYVVQNIDGDRRYSLRMDTLLKGAYDSESIASFLEEITSDVAILLEYFSEYLPLLPAPKSTLSAAFQSSYSASYKPPSKTSFRQCWG